MKIILNDWSDVRDFVGSLNPGLLIQCNAELYRLVYFEPRPDAKAPQTAEPRAPGDTCNGLTGTANLRTGAVTLDEEFKVPREEGPSVADPLPEAGEVAVDADGVPHNTDWHSDPPKLNAGNGTWRARRKRDEDAYQAWLTERREADAAAADAAVSDAEPEPEGVATETHALPQSEPENAEPNEVDPAPHDPAPVKNLSALVAASQESAGDASDSMQDLLTACRDFVSSHSTTAFNALKHAVAPLEGSETGVAVQSLTPDQRRLMRACMDNYALFV